MKKKKPGKNEKFHVQVPRKTGKKREVLDEKSSCIQISMLHICQGEGPKEESGKRTPSSSSLCDFILIFVQFFIFLSSFRRSSQLFLCLRHHLEEPI